MAEILLSKGKMYVDVESPTSGLGEAKIMWKYF